MPARKTTKSSRKAQPASSSSVQPAKTTAVRNNKKPFLIGVAIVIAIALLWSIRGWFVAATVNGKPVSRLAVIRELESQSGKQVLDNLISESLIKQEATNQNIEITDEELAAELATIETNLKTQGQEIETALAQAGMTLDDLRERITTQKSLEKMVGGKIKVSTAEIDEFIEANGELFSPEASPEAIAAQVRDQLAQQKLSEEIQKFLQKLREKANINYYVDYGSTGQ